MTVVKASVLTAVVEHVGILWVFCFGFGGFKCTFWYNFFTGACYLGRGERPYDTETVGINMP